ncbi:hypothetical protein AMATHDRAFT_58844 [Amanita thiersii Skay4041]|uniref:PPM-type phosphatase domain-containing protein n=1 Tax=Amanita thiersii Skay4041 TaxID=703135 RepID=A0A2A9NN05_9AGAR|nr:hypothetical protein AMATHDRAFT_58844 [Amanita thiersii Skay4041]
MSSETGHSPNARSKSLTSAELETYGVLNRQSLNHPTFRVGISEDRGSRRTMEDAHSFVVDFDSVRGQGFFAVFDGHAGKHAAEWCGSHFHEYLLSCLHASPATSIPDVFNETFHKVDEHLSRISADSDGKIHSGCTAVTAFLRIEDEEGCQSFLARIPSSQDDRSSHVHSHIFENPVSMQEIDRSALIRKDDSQSDESSRKSLSDIPEQFMHQNQPSPNSRNPITGVTAIIPPASAKRILYSANAGDARAVLCRAGKAVRLTYDHKGSDKQEAKRITDAGGFVMSGRVNGVLAVTRSLGDPSMKEFVVGAPYTTETQLHDEDEFLILACDGLWDVISDQSAIDLVRDVVDAQEASEILLKHALAHHTMDNVTVLIVRFMSTVS